jgi:lambda family phage portal protein
VLLRNRSRAIVRDNPYGDRALAALAGNTVGTGILAKWPDPQANQARWAEWCARCDWEAQLDFYGLQGMIARAIFESGEVLVRRMYVTPESERDNGLRLQVLEADFLDPFRFTILATGGVIIRGIEFDSLGRRVAYWLFQRHPGDVLPLLRGGYISQRVPASDVLHIYEKKRPGQILGVPRFASALMRLRDLDEYEEAELVRKKIEACFAGFVSTPESGRTLVNADQTSTDDANRRQETLSPGMLEYLQPGETITFGSPASSAGHGDYTSTVLHAIAAGIGVTYEQLTGDFSKVNYSSYRGGANEFYLMTEIFRWHTFIPMGLAPIAQWYLEAAYAAGNARSLSYVPAWTAPKRQSVDPEKDIKATKEAIRGGLSSLSEGIRELGYDPDGVLQEIADERKKLGELGVSTDTDPASIGSTTKTIRETIAGTVSPAEAAVAGAVDANNAAAASVHELRDEVKDGLNALGLHLEAALRSLPAPPAPSITFNQAATTIDVHEGDTVVNVPEREAIIQIPKRMPLEREVTQRDGDGLIVKTVERELDP